MENFSIFDSPTVRANLFKLIEKLHNRIGGVVRDIARLNAEPAPGSAEQKAIGETVLAALSAWVGESGEREFCLYRGFKVILPAGMQKDKPFLWLCGEERYYVEIGKSPVGLIRRLEHRLSTLTGVLIEFNNRVEQAGQEVLDLQASLAAADPYTPVCGGSRTDFAPSIGCLELNKPDRAPVPQGTGAFFPTGFAKNHEKTVFGIKKGIVREEKIW